MDKQSKGAYRKKLLEIIQSGNINELTSEITNLLQSDIIEWDLVTLVLSMIPKMENTSGLFETCVSLLNGRQDIPENTCSSILTDFAHFDRVEDAFEMLKTMKQNGIELRNRHVSPLIDLANKNKDTQIMEHVDRILSQSSLKVNQSVRSKELLFYSQTNDVGRIIETLRNIAQEEDYIHEPSVIQALQKFCVLNPSWSCSPIHIKGATCSHCHEQLQKFHLTNDQRDLLLLGIEAMTQTSQNRSQSFQQFKKAIDSFDYDVVIDGANVGFSTSNRREASQTPFSLRISDIQSAVDSFLDQHKRPLVILHNYHIRHLKRFQPQQLAVLDELQANRMLYYVQQGSNDDWYWLYASLRRPHCFLLSNDQMRDHLFQAEHEEQLLRKYREETQITYRFVLNAEKKQMLKLYFPKPYSTCIQEFRNGFHLPVGKMELSTVHVDRWFCFLNKMASLSQFARRIR